MKNGPVILVEDDEDDKAVFVQVLKEIGLPNEIIWFKTCVEAFTYLKTTTKQPFIIFSDVNLPVQSGIEFKKQIDADKELRRKSIPFIFYSTAVDQHFVNKAYTEMTIQGFFQKESRYELIKKNLKAITDYWLECRHPNAS
jgi:response regulator RpfG family c-di-GMP phosphodiesterase